MASTTSTINIRDISPLTHLTSDIAKSQFNYESAMNAIVEWNNSKMPTVTMRLSTYTAPYFVDYTFPTKYAAAATTGNIITNATLGAGCFAINEMLNITAMHGGSTQSDTVHLRLNVQSVGSTSWELWERAVIYDEVVVIDTEDDSTNVTTKDFLSDGTATYSRTYPAGTFIRACLADYNNGHPTLFQTITPVSKGTLISTATNCMPVIKAWEKGLNHTKIVTDRNVITYGNSSYWPSGDTGANQYPTISTSGYEEYAAEWIADTWYAYGSYVMYDGEFYVCISEDGVFNVEPYSVNEVTRERIYNTLKWERALLLPKADAGAITTSRVYRDIADTDISGYVLRNDGTDEADGSAEISAMANISVTASDSVEHRGMAIFNTCNYSYWPNSGTKWQKSSVYGPTDAEKSVYQLQDYTAVMIFNHSDATVKKTNIINYDGPDLDQGLAIFLPRYVTTSKDGLEYTHEPEDGFMFEFMFRIWPHPELNGATTNDLIINKSQIYVYHCETDDIEVNQTFDPSEVFPIAKFSMARMTNFYVFSENIGVPNRPVIYKARFIYHKDDAMWRTYDYYQVPDHLFLSPKGFCDPQNSGEDNYRGVETAGFPMFQDPFSGYDLRPLYDAEDFDSKLDNIDYGFNGRVLGTDEAARRKVITETTKLIRVSGQTYGKDSTTGDINDLVSITTNPD